MGEIFSTCKSLGVQPFWAQTIAGYLGRIWAMVRRAYLIQKVKVIPLLTQTIHIYCSLLMGKTRGLIFLYKTYRVDKIRRERHKEISMSPDPLHG